MAYRSAFTLFKISKDAVLNNPLPFFTLIFLPSFLIVIADAMNGNPSWTGPKDAAANPTESSVFFYAIGGLMSFALFAAGIYLELKAAKGKQLATNDTFNGSLPYFLRLLGLIILLSIIIILGLLALIIPGLIFIQWFYLAPYFLVDKNLGVIEAMKASKAASRGNAGAIWSVIGVMILLSLFSFIPIFGGFITLVLVTLYTCAPALRYYELVGKSKSPSPPNTT